MIKEMKIISNKPYILTAIMFLIAATAFSLEGNRTETSLTADSAECGKNLSAYRSFFKLDLYKDAYTTWIEAFNNCPASSEMMYLDGVTMYRSFIEEAPSGPVREGRIDTLMLIYDRRMENFGGEGNVLGRKGKDLLTYRGSDIDQVQEAYEMLKKSLELEGKKSQESVMLLFMSAGMNLKNAGRIDDSQVIEGYFMVAGILDQLEGSSSRWAKTRTRIDEMMLKEDILTCDALNRYFKPQVDEGKNDKVFLERVMTIYSKTGCYLSDIYEEASENLYIIDPGPQSAHNLAMLYISKSDYLEAAKYLKMAVLGDNLDNETRAQWFYELAIVSNANKEFCEAIYYAREAIRNKSDFGKAYLTLGDAIISSRGNLGDDLSQRAAFWVAADKYGKAASVDRSLEMEVKQKLIDIAIQYPNKEDVFFLDLKDGDIYHVGGCINEDTTVKSGK
jgi:hypothetical protein